VVEHRWKDRDVESSKQLPVNPDLVWDYEIPDEGCQDEPFRRWYVARVLTRGRMTDIQDLGLRTIHSYLPHVVLPTKIRRFWEWYFSLPDVKARYGTADSPTT
jgi:hypothetical protein